MKIRANKAVPLLLLLALAAGSVNASDGDNDAAGGSVANSSAASGTDATPAASPAADPAPAHPELRPVLDEFGGEAGLVVLMDELMTILLEDERTRPFFEFSDQALIKRHLVEQFCVILGGDCRYTGRDMKASHELLGIDRADFNALVEDLQIAMSRRDIPFRAQNRLLQHLAPMHREIITR